MTLLKVVGELKEVGDIVVIDGVEWVIAEVLEDGYELVEKEAENEPTMEELRQL